MTKKIKTITVVSNIGVSKHTVGEDGITSITDASVEFESSLDIIHKVWKGQHCHAEIINCPVEVLFFNPEPIDDSNLPF